MSTLAEFLLARITEDERFEGPWGEMAVAGEDRAVGADERADVQRCWDAFETRIKVECEAKRRIITDEPSDRCDSDYVCHAHDQWERTVRLLALPYADHTDYREEWRP